MITMEMSRKINILWEEVNKGSYSFFFLDS